MWGNLHLDASRWGRNDVRNGVDTLSELFKFADAQGHTNNRVGTSDLQLMADKWDGDSLMTAVRAVHRQACSEFHTTAPTLEQLNKVLGNTYVEIERADADGSEVITAAEQDALPERPRAVADFAYDYRGSQASDFF